MYSSYYSSPLPSSRYRDSGYRSSSSRFLDATSSTSSGYRDSLLNGTSSGSSSRYRPPLPTPNYRPISSSISPSSSAIKNRLNNNVDIGSSRPPFRRSASLSPSRLDQCKYREVLAPVRTLIRESFRDDSLSPSSGVSICDLGIRTRRSPSVTKERTRDELIDSIVHTRTREHRVMPGFHSTTNWEERKAIQIDCDKVYPGILLANGETIKNINYLKNIGVTHVLNTAEKHVQVNPAKYPLHGISYFGFHVDDHPSSNISRFFSRTTEFIDEAIKRGGLIVVNCVMGWSRSATVVAAYLMMKKGMNSSEALETIRQARPIRPNPGFLQQLADHENLMNKKLYWDGSSR